MRKLFLMVFFFCFLQISYSQSSRNLSSLQQYIQSNSAKRCDSTLKHITFTPRGSLHYLYPFYQLFGEEAKFRNLLSESGYKEELSQVLSFAGDYESALEYQPKPGDSIYDRTQRQITKTVGGLKNIKHSDAKKYISFIARNFQVIMINEAHNKPLHRAFTLSLLQDLYKKGFRYLAMEMLNNNANHSLDKLTPATGYYSSEPVAGELIRTALDMGYRLVSYEDTLAAQGQHNANERDSIQALNIYKILQKDPDAKILVHAGYGHIAEKNLEEDFRPMGMVFKKISGIDPLTIDQTEMTEDADLAYGRLFYDIYLQKFPLSVPSIALIDDQPVNVTNNSLYDIVVIHPRTIYRDGRPTWLNLDGRRQGLYVKPPNKKTFLVQAYYQFESFGNKPGQVIPADQTYIPTGKGNFLLYLKRGKYIIIFRDMDYKILNTQHIEVN
jgi:hypothetical protein